MMSEAQYAAFSDELSKMAGVLGKVTGALGRSLKKGWHGPGGEFSWMGKGKVTKYLPVGEKSWTAIPAAMAAPGLAQKQDPMGQNRGRAERISQFVGGTLGGLAGMGALSRAGGSWARPLIGSIVGSIAGETAASYPFRKARLMSRQQEISPEQRKQLMRQAQFSAAMPVQRRLQ